jgi:predicted nucleotidyltransferase
MARTDDLRALAQQVADAIPTDVAEEIVLTGSVSRGVADELSDIEMLVVTRERLSLERCYELAGAAGLTELDTWGPQGGPTQRVFGFCDGVPVETVWWDREFAQSRVDGALAGESQSTGDALSNGVSLRTTGLLARWQEQLSHYPDELVASRVEQAALPWGGFAPAGVLTIIRPGDRLALTEWLVESATRVLTIVFALNRVWLPTTKRLAARVEALDVKPERLAERVEQALAEPDPRRALQVMTELQIDAVALAPSGPNVDRASAWLRDAAHILKCG